MLTALKTNRFTKTGVKALAATMAAVSLMAAAPQTAEAGDGDALVAGFVGLAAGTILGGAIAAPRPIPHYQSHHYTYAPPPPPAYHVRETHTYYRPAYRPVHSYSRTTYSRTTYRAPAYHAGPQPWTAEWYQYCDLKYRSFDPASGTFQPYHGPRRLCR